MASEASTPAKETVARRLFTGQGILGLIAGALLLGPRQAAAAPQAEPAVQSLDIFLGEGEVIGETPDGEDEVIGEYHRWEPNTLVVHRADRVQLTVRNPRKAIHSWVLEAWALDTGPLDPRTGSTTLEFTAEKAGVFQFRCGIPHDHEKGECDPDHKSMTGYLIVLEK